MRFLHLICLIFFHCYIFGQLLNSSFEKWTFHYDSTTYYNKWLLDEWIHCDQDGNPTTSPYLLGTKKDTTSVDGKYSLQLHRWYNHANDEIRLIQNLSTKPTVILGNYKYRNNELMYSIKDTAIMEAWILSKGDTIGYGIVYLIKSDQFIPFEMKINYSETELSPDSINILISPTKFSFEKFCFQSPRCSYLSIDNLQYNTTSGYNENEDLDKVNIFPNPAVDKVFIHTKNNSIFDKVEIINFHNEVIKKEINISKIDISELTKGVYFLRLFLNSKIISIQKIIKI